MNEQAIREQIAFLLSAGDDDDATKQAMAKLAEGFLVNHARQADALERIADRLDRTAHVEGKAVRR